MMANPTRADGDAPEADSTRGDQPVFLGREATPTGETVKLTPEQEKARQRRSRWIALALGAFVILIFVITLTKLGANVLVREL
jgi:hypothetical protein